MPNDFYTASGTPAQGSAGASAAMRAEFNAIVAAFDKLPALAGNAGRVVTVNAGATALTVSSALTISGSDVTIGGAMTAAAFNAVADSASLRVQLATSAGTNGLRVADQTGTRRLELLHLGSTHPGVYGAVANDAVLNVPGTGKLLFSMADTARLALTQSGDLLLGLTTFTVGAAARRYLVLGSPDTGTPGLGVLSFYPPTANQGNNGTIEWYDPGNTLSLSTRNAYIFSGSEGATANNRGSFLAFATKPNGVSSAGDQVVKIDSNGYLLIGSASSAYFVTNRKAVEIVGQEAALLGLNTAANGNAYLFKSPGGPGDLILMNESAATLHLGTNNVNRLSVTSAGNVTIGGSASGVTLTVEQSSAGAVASVLSKGTSDTNFQVISQVGAAGTGAGTLQGFLGLQYAGTGKAAGLQFYRGVGPTDALLTIMAGGADRLAITSDGRFYGTALHNNAGAVTGTTNQYIASGTYTPTGTPILNVAAFTTGAAQWTRVGNVVTVTGTVSLDPTSASTTTVLAMSLPIASNFTTTQQAAGVGAAIGVFGLSGGILSDPTNDRVELTFFADAGALSQNWYFSFSYQVV